MWLRKETWPSHYQFRHKSFQATDCSGTGRQAHNNEKNMTQTNFRAK